MQIALLQCNNVVHAHAVGVVGEHFEIAVEHRGNSDRNSGKIRPQREKNRKPERPPSGAQ